MKSSVSQQIRKYPLNLWKTRISRLDLKNFRANLSSYPRQWLAE
jgi:hypothetical protein